MITLKYGSPAPLLRVAYQGGRNKYRRRLQDEAFDMLRQKRQFAQQQALLGQREFFQQGALDQRLGAQREMFEQRLAFQQMTAQQRVRYNAQQKQNDRAFRQGKLLPFPDAGMAGGQGQGMLGGQPGQAPLMIGGPGGQQQPGMLTWDQMTPQQRVTVDAQVRANDRARRQGNTVPFPDADQGMMSGAQEMDQEDVLERPVGGWFGNDEVLSPEQKEAEANAAEIDDLAARAMDVDGDWQLSPLAQKQWAEIRNRRAKTATDRTINQTDRDEVNRQLDEEELQILRTGQRKPKELTPIEQFGKDTIILDPETGQPPEPGKKGIRMWQDPKSGEWKRVDMGEKEAQSRAEKEEAEQKKIIDANEKKAAKDRANQEKADQKRRDQIDKDMATARARVLDQGNIAERKWNKNPLTFDEVLAEAEKLHAERDAAERKFSPSPTLPGVSVDDAGNPLPTPQGAGRQELTELAENLTAPKPPTPEEFQVILANVKSGERVLCPDGKYRIKP